MQVNHRVARIGMAEQRLNDWQFGAAVEQGCREAVPKRVRVDGFADTGAPRRFATGVPDGFLGDGLVWATRLQAGEQPTVASPDGAVVSPELSVELRAEWHFAVFAALALTDTNDHPL